MVSLWSTFVNIHYKKHLLISIILRIVLVVYGIHHDQISKLKYTDIDYKVFTDASRHYLEGNSPYNRHTYRYSPLVAILLIPNVTLHHSFGKILFCSIDIIVALLIRLIVKNTIKEYECYKQKDSKKSKLQDISKLKNANGKNRKKLRQSNKQHLNVTKAELESKNYIDLMSDTAMMVWLYNPMTIAIGTRGNCDTLAGFLVLLTLYFLQCKRYIFLTGIIHGISIHFRLYPIIYSLTYFMFLSKYSFYTTEDRRKNLQKPLAIDETPNLKKLKNIENTIVQTSSMGGHKLVPQNVKTEKRTIFKKEYLVYLVPNLDQLKLISGCLLSLSFLTWYFYSLFGYTFLYETYLYHVLRKDPRHNFSLYFYLQYLTAWVKNIGYWQKALMILPQLVLILVFSVRYGLNRFSLNFSILTQTIVMVIYNGVLTSQYFVWVMAVLPLCLWQIKLSKLMGAVLLLIWYIAQGVWLLPAYLLEFQGQNTFLYIWIQSVSFFCANIAILGRLIMYFMPIHDKGE
ncbi:GPI mannosyltransferase 1 [Diabrotica virgifera virgifera]|uniref:GPI alpha-1,4-mannosyltransferase I, catalytic subunit n=1 Tax=Diabrotica virgifera virgifera TaxID=50390 RepID=A0ABM5L7L7_DIAVI|nr:GPI mannosyltransferase 1 [Diabrotica virgifera virgifera]